MTDAATLSAKLRGQLRRLAEGQDKRAQIIARSPEAKRHALEALAEGPDGLRRLMAEAEHLEGFTYRQRAALAEWAATPLLVLDGMSEAEAVRFLTHRLRELTPRRLRRR